MIIYLLTLKICYAVFKWLPGKDQVLFISRRNSKNSIEFTCLIDEIQQQYPHKKVVVLNNMTTNKIKTLINSYIEAYHLAQSRYVIVDSYVIPVSTLKHKSTTRIIQVWHALGAIKRFGHGSINKPSGSSAKIAKTMQMHKGYDFIISGSEATIDIYRKGFNVPKERIIPLGTPTVDYLLDEKIHLKKFNDIQAEYNLDPSKEVILFAPTFRKNKQVNTKNLLDRLDTTKYTVVVKAHPLDVINSDNTDVIVDTRFSTTDWLFVADRVISDYSAIIFEASVLDLPQYHYVYDYKDYDLNPGFFMDYYREMPGVISQDADGIAHAIENQSYDIQKANNFKNKYIRHLDGSSTRKIIDLLFKE